MALEKLKIFAEKNQVNDFAEVIEVLFNPNQVVIQKTGWKENGNNPIADEQPATLNLQLFFDTTLTGFPPKNVQYETRKIYSFTQIRGTLKRPPRCKLRWGKIWGNSNELLPMVVLTSITKTLTQFWEDGTPVRATLNCNFQEWQDPQQKKKIQNPIDDPIHIVKRGETLSSIAAQEYNDPSLWRIIAQTNRINNPLKLEIGQVLTVPPLPNVSSSIRK